MDVLVIADSKFGSSLIRRALANLGHTVVETSTAGAGTLLASRQWRADLVVAAVVASTSSRQRYGAVGIELGIALERGLPIVLVARPGLSLPFLSGFPRVDYADDDVLLSAQLQLLISAITEGLPTDATQRRRSPASGRPQTEPANLDPQSFEQGVARLLQAHAPSEAVVYTSVEPLERVEADFAIYFPEKVHDIGVVLVEVKSVSGDDAAARKRLTNAARNLSNRVLASRSGLGLLIYQGPPVGLPVIPMTVALSYDDLAHRLELEPLFQILRQARNQAIHAL